MPAPMPIEMREFMMRLRSSVRCSKKVMAPAGSSSGVALCGMGGSSGTGSGGLPGVLRSFMRFDGGGGFSVRALGLLGRHGGGSGSLRSLLTLRLKGLALHFAHLFFERAFKVRRGLAELRHELPQAAGEFGELLRPKDDEDHDKHHDHVRDA